MSTPTASTKKCFDGLLAIDGQCGEPAPSSGIFLRQLGLTRSEMSAYLTAEYRDAGQLFADKFAAAVLNTETLVHNYFTPRYKAFTILENRRVGIFQNNLQMIAGEAGRYKGLHFKYDNRNSFMDLGFSSFAMQLNHEGVIDLLLIDLLQGRVLKTIPVSVFPNEIVELPVSEVVASDRKLLNTFLCYDAGGIEANKTLIQVGQNCCSGGAIVSGYLTIRPASMDKSVQKIDQNLRAEQDTGGLSVLYSLSCNHRNWICSIAGRLALSIAYATCAEIIEHAIYQAGKEQINIRVGSGDAVEELEKRRAIYSGKATGQLKNVLNNVQLPSDDLCFVCRQTSRTAVLIP